MGKYRAQKFSQIVTSFKDDFLLTFRKLLKGQSVLWLKLNKLDLLGGKVLARLGRKRNKTEQRKFERKEEEKKDLCVCVPVKFCRETTICT